MYDHKLISSFLLFMDHEFLSQGEAFQNYAGLFYPMASKMQGYAAYACSFRGLVNDTSITGANVMTGVYLNGQFTTIGQSGLTYINHSEGTIYFNNPLPPKTVISGNFSVKDFNIEITDQLESKLLLNTKYVSNSKYNQTLSGLPLDTKTSPAIFLKTKSMENIPFALGRMDDNSFKIRAIVIPDNEFQRIGACNILKNFNYRPFSLVDSTPFDYRGNYTGLNFNYNNLNFNTGYFPYILQVKAIDVPLAGEFSDLGKNNISMVDFTVSTIMLHP